MSKVTDVAVQAAIIARRGAGESCESIGKSLGMHRTTVHRFVKNHPDTVSEIKEKIFADNIDNYTETLEKDVKNSGKIADSYAETGKITTAEVAYKTTTNKAIAPVLVDKGIHPSSAFFQMNIDNSKSINVDQDVFNALAKGFDTGYVEMHDVIEVEAEEEKSAG